MVGKGTLLAESERHACLRILQTDVLSITDCLQATVSHRSPFQNGGDLDHLGSIPFEQICGIGSHMFFLRLLITKDHAVLAFMNCVDIDFICLQWVLCVWLCFLETTGEA